LGYDKEGTFEEFKNIDIKVFGKKGHVSKLLPERVSNAVYYGWNFYNLKIKENYDVINPHMSPSEWIRNNNPRALWYCHTPPRELYDPTVANLRQRSLKEKILYRALSRVYSRTEKKIVNEIEAIATNSKNTANRINRVLHKEAHVINPAIDYKDFMDNGDGKYFLYPSRIAEQKRQEYAIEAFSIFRKIYKYKDYKLVLAGGMSKRYSDFNKYYEKLKAMKLENVIFKTNIANNELINIYSRATALLYTPINEDFGIVPLEGMASYKPVIAVNEGGPRETIVDGKNGFLVNSPKEMAERMRFIVENPSLSQKMGKEGRKRVEKYYSWRSFFVKFDKLAREVAKK
jgi:glycosyltransferase involved in cell wall biosynthesis